MIESLSKKLCQLSRVLISQEPPFDRQIYSDSIASQIFLNYLKYKDDPEIPNRERLLEHFTCLSEYLIKDSLLGKAPAYNKTHKELLKAEDQFVNWYFPKEKKEMTDLVIDLGRLHGINFKNEIVDEVAEIQPSFNFQKKKSRKYLIAFAKEIGDTGNQFAITFNGSPRRAFFSVEIGLDDPEFLLDISCLLARSQSKFDFSNTSELRQGLKDAFAFIDVIYPTIATSVKAFSQ